MKQSLHIFFKDIRHLWPDLVLYGVLLLALGWVIPLTRPGAPFSNTLLQTFSSLIEALIPIVWLVIVARLVHDESLVGNQQFWVTRPYSWPCLLSAKLLFIMVCILGPFVAVQWLMLLQVGLNPLAAMTGWLLSLVYFVLIVILPFMVVATVTATLTQMFLTVIGLLIFGGGALTLLTIKAGPHMSPPFVIEIFSILFGSLLVGIVVHQYALRNTTGSRIELISTMALLLGLFYGVALLHLAGPMNMLIRYRYPASKEAPARLVLNSSPHSYTGPTMIAATPGADLLYLNLPVQLEGLSPSLRLNDVNVSFSLAAPEYHWSARLEMCQWIRETLDKESVWDEARSMSLSRW